MEAIARWCEGHVIKSAIRSFVRVPVDRPSNLKQTEASVGRWVIVSIQHGNRSFKVYTEEWLRKQFFEMPDEPVDEGIVEDIESVEEIVLAEVPYRAPASVRPIPVQFRPGNTRAVIN